MASENQTLTPHIKPGSWEMSEDVTPISHHVRNAVSRINKKLQESGVKHKIINPDRPKGYCYDPYRY